MTHLENLKQEKSNNSIDTMKDFWKRNRRLSIVLILTGVLFIASPQSVPYLINIWTPSTIQLAGLAFIGAGLFWFNKTR